MWHQHQRSVRVSESLAEQLSGHQETHSETTGTGLRVVNAWTVVVWSMAWLLCGHLLLDLQSNRRATVRNR